MRKVKGLLIATMAVYILAAFVYAGRGYLPSGLPSWWGDGKTHIIKFVKATGNGGAPPHLPTAPAIYKDWISLVVNNRL